MMKKLILFFVMMFTLLHAFDYDYCGGQRGIEWTYLERGRLNPYSPPNYGTFCSTSESGNYRFTITTYTTDNIQKFGYMCYEGYVRVDPNDSHSVCKKYVPPTCENNETLVNGECQPLLPSSCPFAPFEIDSHATNQLECDANMESGDYSASLFVVVTGKTDTCCLKPKGENYDCSKLGTNWTSFGSMSKNDCDDNLDNVLFDGAQLVEGTLYEPTCCMHSKDNNATTPNDSNDTNGSTPDNGDNNDDNPPSADSTPASDPTDDILKSIQSDLGTQHSEAMTRADETNSILGDIKSDIGTASDKNHEDLKGLKESNHEDLENVNAAIGTSSNRNHKDLEGMDDKLKGIEDNTEFLKDLKDDFGDAEISLEKIEEEFNKIKGALANSKDSVSSSLGGFMNSLNGVSVPAFTSTGESSFRVIVYGSPVVFDFSMVANLRQYFDIVWLLLLAYLNFKIYRWIIETILKMGV